MKDVSAVTAQLFPRARAGFQVGMGTHLWWVEEPCLSSTGERKSKLHHNQTNLPLHTQRRPRLSWEWRDNKDHGSSISQQSLKLAHLPHLTDTGNATAAQAQHSPLPYPASGFLLQATATLSEHSLAGSVPGTGENIQQKEAPWLDKVQE
jgi:hypothetical protein